jgi:RNA polymerase sigma-70 factor (ECF subfamily)
MEPLFGQFSSAISPELLALVAKGDQKAFTQLYDQSCSLLFRLALRILGDRDETAEVLQEVYVEVWHKVVRYDPGRGSPMAWLVTLTRSRAVDRFRARAARGRHLTRSIDDSPAVDMQDNGPGPFENRAEAELRNSVAKALSELPEGQQQALELAYYEGLSHTEIAHRLQQPVGTIKTRIRLGMSKLKDALRPHWEHV